MILLVTGFIGGGQEILRLVPLSVPMVAGLDPVTRIRYAVPATVFDGMIALMEPEVVELSVPMFTGEAKFPVASESCAVKIFPEVNEPLVVNATLTLFPIHKEEDVNGDVLIVSVVELPTRSDCQMPLPYVAASNLFDV